MTKGNYAAIGSRCLEISDYDAFLRSVVDMTRQGNLGYDVVVDNRVERDGRTKVYRMTALLRMGKTSLMRYFDKEPTYHHNDVEGSLNLREETEEFAQSVEEGLAKAGLRVEKEGLVLKLSRD